MNILIVGLGIIGASYAKGLKDKGHTIYGVDIKQDTIDFALKNEIIDYGSLCASDFIYKAKLIIIGLYPNDILDFLKKHKHLFNRDQVITDVCGVKRCFLDEAIKTSSPASYISHHPMAGKEKVGITFSDPNIFKKANFLIIDEASRKEDIKLLEDIAHDLEFMRISVMSKEKHDKMIGFTSQLAHAIAVALVNSDTESDTKNFIGDSYRDLTRIAKINKDLWSELFFSNKDYLINEIDNFEFYLDKIKTSLINDDKKLLEEQFISAKEIREKMEK